jgi:hypothetical protein
MIAGGVCRPNEVSFGFVENADVVSCRALPRDGVSNENSAVSGRKNYCPVCGLTCFEVPPQRR